MDFEIPFAMKFIRKYFNSFEFLVAYLFDFLIYLFIEPSMDFKSRGGPSICNQVYHDFESPKRYSTPVSG